MLKTSDFLLKFRLFLNKFKIPGIIYFNKLGIIPGPGTNMQTVVGKGIKCPKIEKPTKEEVAHWHRIYV